MKSFFLTFVAAVLASHIFAQSAIVSSDTSQIIFPSSVMVSLSRGSSSTARFEISSRNLRVLVTEINFLLARLQLEQKNVRYFRKNEEVMKSLVTVTERKYLSELERTLLHKDAYEKLEGVSAAYQRELERCMSDLDVISSERQKDRKRGFVKGLVWGMISGAALGILVDASLR